MLTENSLQAGKLDGSQELIQQKQIEARVGLSSFHLISHTLHSQVEL